MSRFFMVHCVDSSGYISVLEYQSIFNYFYVIGPQSSRAQRNKANYTAIYAVQGHTSHRFWYQSKAHMRLPISD